MKYIEHGAGGDADCMKVAEGPTPAPGPGQILIEVVCACLLYTSDAADE